MAAAAAESKTNNLIKLLDDNKIPGCSTTADLVTLAGYVENAERYEDMTKLMERVVHMKYAGKDMKRKINPEELGIDERNMLSVAYKNVVGKRRSSWRNLKSEREQRVEGGSDYTLPIKLHDAYQKVVESELESKCNEVLHLLDTYLIDKELATYWKELRDAAEAKINDKDGKPLPQPEDPGYKANNSMTYGDRVQYDCLMTWMTDITKEDSPVYMPDHEKHKELVEEAKEWIKTTMVDNKKAELKNALLKERVTQVETLVFYLKMCGDYHRYLAEFLIDDEKKHEAESKAAESNYKDALKCAEAALQATHPTRLGLSLNMSVCYYEILNKSSRACDLAKSAFDNAIQKLDSLNDANYKDSTLIMQLLRDNLQIWSSENENAANNEENDKNMG